MSIWYNKSNQIPWGNFVKVEQNNLFIIFMKGLHMIAFILLVIGGLNWLLVGLNVGWDLGSLLGDSVSRIVFILVGLSAILEAVTHKGNCKRCGSGSAM